MQRKEDKQVRVESAIVGAKLEENHLEQIINTIFFFDSLSHPLKEKEDVEKMIVDDYAKNIY